MIYLMHGLFYGIPLAAIVFFIVSLVLYCSARRQVKRQPGSISSRKLKTYKTMLIVSSVIAGVLAAVVIGCVGLMFMAVAFM